MPKPVQLECRIVITHHRAADPHRRRIELGMFDVRNDRYEPLGRHAQEDLERVVRDLAREIEQAGHKLTFCERTA